MDAQHTADNPRVAVNLKGLVDLAKPAAAISLGHANIRAAQSGNYLSHLKGRGMAFDETRLYQPGDDVRRIDWRVTARTGKPHSKIFKEERERPMFIAVDYRAAMAFATRGVFKSVQAARLAALLAWAALQQGDRIGGQIFSEAGCLELRPQTGKPALLRFLNALVKPAYSGDAADQLDIPLSRLLHHARPGSRVYILSDFRGLNPAAERHLTNLAKHCEVVMVHIADPLEMRLPSKGRYRFTDGLREILFDSADRQRAQSYQQQFADRRRLLQKLSSQLHSLLIPCSTQQAALDVLTGARPHCR